MLFLIPVWPEWVIGDILMFHICISHLWIKALTRISWRRKAIEIAFVTLSRLINFCDFFLICSSMRLSYYFHPFEYLKHGSVTKKQKQKSIIVQIKALMKNQLEKNVNYLITLCFFFIVVVSGEESRYKYRIHRQEDKIHRKWGPWTHLQLETWSLDGLQRHLWPRFGSFWNILLLFFQ